jgi:GDP-L-fucose synthase
MSNEKNKRIFIAGHNGLVGGSIKRMLERKGYVCLVTRAHDKLDLTDQASVANFFAKEHIDEVYLAAAKVGGIYANSQYPADFIYNNLMIQNNVIYHSFLSGVKKLLFLGSSCIYPKINSQPMSEESLMVGKLEPTNEPYAVAKIAGIKLCESLNRQYGLSHGIDYRSIMPTNIYGPGDNFHPNNGHVIPSLLSKMHQAKINNDLVVDIWGSGTQRREFLYVDDMAEASYIVMNSPKSAIKKIVSDMESHINAGYGEDITIAELAHLIAEIVGYTGQIIFDRRKPDGSPQKLLNIKKIQTLGFAPKVNLRDGIIRTYDFFLTKRTNEQ